MTTGGCISCAARSMVGRSRGVRQRRHQLGSFFGALLDQYLGVVRSGLPMPPASVARAEAAVASLKGRSMSHQAVDDITERAVEWVCLNPVLVEADLPDVGR
jgi:hypothetical protein